jgi:hypothetical protein
MLKTIEIKIGEMGEIEVEAQGYRDNLCLDALKDIEKALGKAKEVKLKPEGHRVAVDQRVKS